MSTDDVGFPAKKSPFRGGAMRRSNRRSVMSGGSGVLNAAGWPADLDALATTRGRDPEPAPRTPPHPTCPGLCKGFGVYRRAPDWRARCCPSCNGSGRADVKGDGVV